MGKVGSLQRLLQRSWGHLKLNFFFYSRTKIHTTMIYKLYEIFPAEIIFKILSYRPHATADMIKLYWHRKKYNRVVTQMNDMFEYEMHNTVRVQTYVYYSFIVMTEMHEYFNSQREKRNQEQVKKLNQEITAGYKRLFFINILSLVCLINLLTLIFV
jgi:hypothetical protein